MDKHMADALDHWLTTDPDADVSQPCEWQAERFRWPFGFLERYAYRWPWLWQLPLIVRHETCDGDGIECVPPWSPMDGPQVNIPNEWYCRKHAHRLGYCWACGEFNGGMESFDLDPCGLCDDCRRNPDVTGEYDDDDEWDDSYDDYDHQYDNVQEG